MKEKEQETKKRIKGAKGRIAARIVAALIAILMIVASSYSLIYYLINA